MDEILSAVFDSIESRMVAPGSLDGLSEIEADLMVAVTAKGVIDNGGHAYWYEGKNFEETIRTADAFDRMSLPDAATALRKSLDAFRGGVPPADLGERQDYVSTHRKRLEEVFKPLDKVIWKTDFYDAALSYVRANAGRLIAIDSSLRSFLERLEY
jgi:hypothetical protein